LQEAGDVRLLEPYAELEVTVPEQSVGAVLSDLTSLRRAQVRGVSEGEGEEWKVVSALVPLASLLWTPQSDQWDRNLFNVAILSPPCGPPPPGLDRSTAQRILVRNSVNTAVCIEGTVWSECDDYTINMRV
jgi:hypothetical protein